MSLLDEIQKLQAQASSALESINSADALEAWRIKYLGSKGLVKDTMNRLKEVPKELKRDAGQACNKLKNALQDAFKATQQSAGVSGGKARAAAPVEDITLPGSRPTVGHQNIITQTINEICEIFGRMGFAVAYGPEVEDEHHNFDALNIPDHHPARDPLDNFYIDEKVMLRSQTSTVQIRVMENTEPPVRVIAPGRVYRPDTVDATHSFMFHQIEGLYVDENVSMADLKATVDQFCRAYFGHDIVTRFRPSFFPFTEPSAEIDVMFHRENGEGYWIEMGGCGMVGPNVLEGVGYDSEKYTGFAFGLGVERMVMRKHNITDIRYLYESDVRFLKQF